MDDRHQGAKPRDKATSAVTGKVIHEMSRVILYAVLLAVGPALCGCHTWICSVHRDVDINSGDVRERTFLLSFRVNEHVLESSFSREVRRLQISAPEERAWKTMTVSNGGKIASDEYAGAIEDCDFLVQLLNAGHTSDEDRRSILAAALLSLQKGEPDEIYSRILDVDNQIRATHGLPIIPNESRKRGPRID